ncbi:type I-F CRISPR-associated endoribonuclease Cas6/Csy4 [Salmonella enterica]|uniref:type I-F CRISPR-associated endoribonuclease Cas6/Csy4 n=1 Tax=Salmonella enterica TaxID=28901 RepID=UPI0010351EFC|nr:type I-F CRISPR-associated endoribonuclease Cas6/Csy4 [Salmonella enterica]EJJ1581941.1 type I-F CRISPR-associated endoribonuclease Cas6/Csy4 [Salmonella enterica]EJN0204858.1 type I-F CRISPR-associated endoribonuclease Cas6/Csy4 [Salmonella enterica]TBN97372.1 type I-F CRISPR-associated endoribonuclease Cas6/Csy4 [Salmonella enterica subsp. salamae serovar 13,22:z:-]
MDHYQDIQVLPDPEFTQEALMAALFTKLHRALGARGKGDIGVSFPDVGIKPGARLRVHGLQSALAELDAMRWRAGLQDYCQSSAILPTPQVQGWRTVSRVQVKSNPERLMRRSVRKGWLTEEEAQQRLSGLQEQQTPLPWLLIRSFSSGQHYRLFIKHGVLQFTPVSGVFSSYGLSACATIPWF